MAITGHLRGHPITYVDDRWVYSDTNTPTVGNERDCGHCGEPNSEEGHDGCLGTLPGIMNACCGHGDSKEAYVQFSPGNCVRGLDAVAEIGRLKALIIKDCINKLAEFFPNLSITRLNELVVEPKNNIYFRLDDVTTTLEFNCKIVEWLSRPAHKGLSNYWQRKIRKGMNEYLGTGFTVEDLRIIYTYLGCNCNRSATIAFVESGYDVASIVRK